MKRSLVVFVAIAMVAGALQAAPKPCASTVRAALERALQNEREAAARYKIYASKATADGHGAVASLFRAAAYAEEIHVKRFQNAMEERGIDIPPAPAFEITAGETPSNIRAASSAETGERDGVYREALRACEAARDAEVKKIFDQTRDVEAEHANLFNAASRSLSSKTAKTYYVCDRCGFTSDLDLQFCVLCRVKDHPHQVD